MLRNERLISSKLPMYFTEGCDEKSPVPMPESTWEMSST